MSQENIAERSELPFPTDAIHSQVLKIVQDPVLENATILKNFLKYIVDESLQGNSNILKEYTIAINVLHKPPDFNTQENGIVRIHAARLRRMLDVYYKSHGIIDNIKISIPKGSYIPIFSKNNNDDIEPNISSSKEQVIIGILPFGHVSSDELEVSILKGVELQLTTALMKFNNFYVIDHRTIAASYRKQKDIQKLVSEYGLKYLIIGEAHVVKKTLRLYVHLLKANSNQQVWAQMYDKKIMNNNDFEIQDEVVRLVLEQLSNFFN